MGSWLQIVVMLLVVVIPAVAQGIRKMQEQAEIRRIRLERERAEREALRTGRAPAPASNGGPPPSRPREPQPARGQKPAANQRLQELARRRQQQLEQLRRQQRARAQAGQATEPPAPSGPPGQPKPATPGQTRPHTYAPPQHVRRQPAPTPIPRPQQPTRGGRRPAPPHRDPARAAAEARSRAIQAEKERRRRAAEEAQRKAQAPPPPPEKKPISTLAREPAREAPMAVVGGMPTSIAEWRRAIVLTEVLGRPVSERRDHLSGEWDV